MTKAIEGKSNLKVMTKEAAKNQGRGRPVGFTWGESTPLFKIPLNDDEGKDENEVATMVTIRTRDDNDENGDDEALFKMIFCVSCPDGKWPLVTLPV